MAESLYPSFNLPSLSLVKDVAGKTTYKPSFNFDYDIGDIVRDGAGRITLADGKETFAQWCKKQCVTERFTKLAYSNDIGVEIMDAISKENSIEAVQSIIQRTITEALMVNKETEYVREFSFYWDGADGLYVTFLVKGYEWEDEIPISVCYS